LVIPKRDIEDLARRDIALDPWPRFVDDGVRCRSDYGLDHLRVLMPERSASVAPIEQPTAVGKREMHPLAANDGR
jgi:hypothetical protein